MNEEEKIMKMDIDRGEEKESQANIEDSPHKQRPKLDFAILIYVLIGIGLVFVTMLFVNGIIFSTITQQRASYYTSIVASNILFLALIIALKAIKKVSWAELGWKPATIKASIKSILKIWGLTWVLNIIYMLILFSFKITPAQNELQELLQKPTLLILLANIILIAIIAPIVEETIFRGFLFGSLRNYFGCWTAIIISAAIFSGLHFQLVGFVPRFLLGIGLGYLYVKHNSIYPSIGLHALNNLVAVVLVSMFS